MEILYLLIPVSLVLVFLIAGIFLWAVKTGQFDDLEGPGYRILMDDDLPRAVPPIQVLDSGTRVESEPAQRMDV